VHRRGLRQQQQDHPHHPHKGVIVIKLEKPDLKPGDVPDVVLKAGGLPRIVVTDAACEKVIDVVDAKADKNG